MPQNFYRLHYDRDTTLEAMADARSLAGIEHGTAEALTARLRPGDHILAAQWNAPSELGIVRLIGRVYAVTHEAEIVWAATQAALRPTSTGKRFWSSKPHFRFADDVARRYMLASLCDEAFEHVDDLPAMPSSGSRRCGEATRPNTTPHARSARDDPGHVYVLASPYGYKIGKSRRLEERMRFFGVKLPFKTEMVMAGWCPDHSAEEAALHRLFRAKRLEGEWFDLDEADLAVLKDRLARKPAAQ